MGVHWARSWHDPAEPSVGVDLDLDAVRWAWRSEGTPVSLSQRIADYQASGPPSLVRCPPEVRAELDAVIARGGQVREARSAELRLYLAARWADPAETAALLEKGADPNATGPDERRAVQAAILFPEGDEARARADETAASLIERGADVTLDSSASYDWVAVAFRKGLYRTARLLMERGLKPSSLDITGRAVRFAPLDLLASMVKAGAGPIPRWVMGHHLVRARMAEDPPFAEWLAEVLRTTPDEF